MLFHAIKCMDQLVLGVLYAKKKWLEALPPYQGGGGMIKEVKKDSFHMEIFLINMRQAQWQQLK